MTSRLLEPPTPADIEAAYLHGRWLRGQECASEGRMLADLSVEVQQLRAANTALRESLKAAMETVERAAFHPDDHT